MTIQGSTGRISGWGRGLAPLSLMVMMMTCGLAAFPATAQTVGDSSAFGESVNLSLVPLLGVTQPVTSGPRPVISGSAAPAYSLSANAGSSTASTSLTGPVLQTGLLLVNASSQLPGATLTHADATTTNPAVSLGQLLPLLGLTAQTVRADATITGTCGSSLVASGSATLASATASGSLGLGLPVPPQPAPNTVLLNQLGVRIVLNEQIVSGDGRLQQSLTVNAIHISLQNALLSALGVLQGDIVISQAHAHVQCPNGVTPEADLALTGAVTPATATSGAPIQYHLTVANQGPSPATNVILSQGLPAGLSGVTATAGQGSCSPGPPVACSLGTIAAGQSAQVTVAALVTITQGTLVSTANVASSVADPGPGNNAVTLTSNVLGNTAPSADVALTGSASATSVPVGTAASCAFTFINNGPQAAPAVTLPLAISGHVTIVSDTASHGNCTGTAPIVCNLGSMAAGTQATMSMTFIPQSAGPIVCQGSVSSGVADPDPSNNSVSFTLSAVTGPSTPPPVDPGACRIDAVPAATLLIPYFEVDLDNPNGATTLISINNAAASSQLAQVTLWTDWGIPTLSFTVALTGYDVQTLNLRDIVGSGSLPSAGNGPGCPTGNTALSAAMMGHLQAWHTGRQSPLQGNCAAPPRTGRLATGYLTADAVNRCSTLNPTSPGYFAPRGTGVASDHNSLWGDFFLVNTDQDLAHGDPAVHILALPGVFTNHQSFYGTFVNGTGMDDRQPLGTSYASRYVAGGTFDGGTQLIVWRDAKLAHPAPLACGQEPKRMELAGMLFDEQENGSLIASATTTAPWSTQKMILGDASFVLPHPFGWLDLDLWHTGGTQFGNAAQGWVTTVMSANQRFSVGLRAIRLDSACDD